MSGMASVTARTVIQRAHDSLRAVAGDWQSGIPGSIRARLHRIANDLLSVLLASTTN